MVNKKGWIRVIEAFLSAMLIIVILVLVAMNQQKNQPEYNSEGFYNYEASAIRYIELNNTLRGEIIAIPSSNLPLNPDSSGYTFPPAITNAINSKIPGSFICEAQICKPEGPCDYWKNTNNNLYSQQVLITSNITNYNPRKLKIFCQQK